MLPALPDIAIRLQRAAFNRALADADIAAIGPILSKNAMLVTGTDSALLSGRTAQLQTWKREFAASERMIYTRSPDRIEASPIEPIAMEYGHWEGVNTSTGQAVASGTYAAKWRETGGGWVIEAEIYLTLA
ncbi:MAG TPA: DUF4440 domain-containing protein [Sphingobium sp.]